MNKQLTFTNYEGVKYEDYNGKKGAIIGLDVYEGKTKDGETYHVLQTIIQTPKINGDDHQEFKSWIGKIWKEEGKGWAWGNKVQEKLKQFDLKKPDEFVGKTVKLSVEKQEENSFYNIKITPWVE